MSYVASMAWGNESLFAGSRSPGQDGQDGRHAHIWEKKKTLKNLPLQDHQADCLETWYLALGTRAHHSLFK